MLCGEEHLMAGSQVPVDLSRIIINEQSPEQMIWLKERDGERQFPIVIGIFEAWAIERKIKDHSIPRPMTHDLLANTIRELGGELQRVVVTDLDDGTFYAELQVHQSKRDHAIDCRPSDAVALAVRLEVPIFVEEQVFQKLAAGEQ
jgi:bifunctional DNase/RNase